MKKNISLLLTLFLCVATLSAQQVDTITIHSKMGHDLSDKTYNAICAHARAHMK